MKLTQFPNDIQHCQLIFELAQGNQFMSIVGTPKILSRDETDGFISDSSIWTLDSVETQVINKTYSDLPFPFSRFVVNIRLARQCLYYIYSITIPNTVLTILQLLFIALPPLGGDRVSYCTAIVMAFAIQQSTVQSQLPKTSETVYMVLMLTAQMVASMFCTMYALLTMMMAKRLSRRSPKLGNRRVIQVIDAIFFIVTVVSIGTTSAVLLWKQAET